MIKQWSAAIIGLLLMVTGAKSAIAETVLEKIARTGNMTIGVNLNNVPFSYINDKNEPVGYSLDIADRIRAEVAKDLNRDVTLQIVEVSDVKNSIPKLLTGEVDLVCDTAFTWERDKYVDFTVSYAVTGMQLLVSNQSKLKGPEDIAGQAIAVVPNTVAEKSLKLVQPKAKIVPVENLEAGLKAFQAGKVFGVAGDGLQMDGLRQVLGITNAKLVPESPPIKYGVGCMVREFNPGFLRLANYALVKLAEGYYFGDPEDVALVNRWMGPEGVVKVDPEMIKRFFNYISITHEQIPEDISGSMSGSTKP